jgi:6-methylsalicylate decarboxylase
VAAGRGPSIRGGFPAWTSAQAIEFMDRSGTRASVVSVSTPGVHFGNDADARTLARRCNEYLGELISRHPGRFGAFAVVPLPDVDGACLEVAYALDSLGLDGVGLFASYDDRVLSDGRFEPLLGELDRREATVFIHPGLRTANRMAADDLPGWLLDYPADTSRVAIGLVLARSLQRFPRIRFILAHAGGTIPYLRWKLTAAPLIDSRFEQWTPEEIAGELRNFWYETAQAPDAATFGALLQVAPDSQILFGSDWPYCNDRVFDSMLRSFRDVEALTDRQRDAIEYDNALVLFPRLRS